MAFWDTVAAGLVLLAYPVSFGPACWISSRAGLGVDMMPAAYRPMAWSMSRSDRACEVLNWYAQLGASPGWRWMRDPVSQLFGARDPRWVWTNFEYGVI
jgi:hypothetical protein